MNEQGTKTKEKRRKEELEAVLSEQQLERF